MIVYKTWVEYSPKNSSFYTTSLCDGWFLFGIIPLYIRKVNNG